jgi:hypothetical protein
MFAVARLATDVRTQNHDALHPTAKPKIAIVKRNTYRDIWIQPLTGENGFVSDKS